MEKNPKVVYRDLADGQGGVLLHLDTGAYHAVNPTGSAIWHLIDGAREEPQIVAALRERLDDTPADLDREVADFLSDLRERDLLVS